MEHNPRPVVQSRQFQEGAKDASVSECTWTLSALEALRNALYKFKTYLLTYNQSCTVLNSLQILDGAGRCAMKHSIAVVDPDKIGLYGLTLSTDV